jgi:hypothetical protein
MHDGTLAYTQRNVVCASLAESQAGAAASGAKPPGEALAEVVAAAALAVNMVRLDEFVFTHLKLMCKYEAG